MKILKRNAEDFGGFQIGMLQTHSGEVRAVSEADKGNSLQRCDALITKDPAVYLRISVADCIPIGLYDPRTGSVGLIHAGWRGLDKKIVVKTIRLMQNKFSVEPENLFAEMGPHICRDHYEIKHDVAEKFSSFPGAFKKSGGKTFLDLAEVAREQLLGMGVSDKNILIDKRCTFEDKRLPSYRRGDMRLKLHFFVKVPESP